MLAYILAVVLVLTVLQVINDKDQIRKINSKLERDHDSLSHVITHLQERIRNLEEKVRQQTSKNK